MKRVMTSCRIINIYGVADLDQKSLLMRLMLYREELTTLGKRETTLQKGAWFQKTTQKGLGLA